VRIALINLAKQPIPNAAGKTMINSCKQLMSFGMLHSPPSLLF